MNNNSTSNRELFMTELTAAYEQLFTQPEYAFAASRTTPRELAMKMTEGLATRGANKNGSGIQIACKACGIRHTYKAIAAFLNS